MCHTVVPSGKTRRLVVKQFNDRTEIRHRSISRALSGSAFYHAGLKNYVLWLISVSTPQSRPGWHKIRGITTITPILSKCLAKQLKPDGQNYIKFWHADAQDHMRHTVKAKALLWPRPSILQVRARRSTKVLQRIYSILYCHQWSNQIHKPWSSRDESPMVAGQCSQELPCRTLESLSMSDQVGTPCPQLS